MINLHAFQQHKAAAAAEGLNFNPSPMFIPSSPNSLDKKKKLREVVQKASMRYLQGGPKMSTPPAHIPNTPISSMALLDMYSDIAIGGSDLSVLAVAFIVVMRMNASCSLS